MVNGLELFLLKEQAVFGTPEVALLAADLLEFEEIIDQSKDRGSTTLNPTGGAGFRNVPMVPGATMVNLTTKKYLSVVAASDMGQTLTFLKSCGLSDSVATDVHTLTPTLEYDTDYTLWSYSGSKVASGSLLNKYGNLIFAPKFTFENGKPVLVEGVGKGTYLGPATDGTQPTVVVEDPIIPPFLGATVTVNGVSTYGVISGEFDPTSQSTLLKDPTATYGFTTNKKTDEKTKFNLKVYQLLVATDDPETDLLARTGNTLSLAWGTGPYGFTLASAASAATIENIEKDEDEGVSSWNISGVIEDNDWSLVVDNAAP